MRAQTRWRSGQQLAFLFGATIVLPALALALLAFRALDTDHRLAERVGHERLQDAVRRAHAHFERRVLEVRARAEALARGERVRVGTTARIVEVVLSPNLELSPTSVFAWVPDGWAPTSPALPPELQQAENQEFRLPSAKQVVLGYEALLQRVPERWSGWVHLRLARTFARVGNAASSREALQRAASLPDSPGVIPSRFAARFELASASPAEAALLYRDLNAGAWLLEKSPYTYYEMRLREWVVGRLPPETLAAEHSRQAMSRLLERTLHGESGWLVESPVAALVTRASYRRAAAVLTPENQWKLWLAEIAKEAPSDVTIQAGPRLPGDLPSTSVSLASLGLPWSVWSEPRDAGLARSENESRRRLLLSILLLVGGVLVFGSSATVWMVRRELRIAQLQSDFTATVSHEFRSPLTGIRQLSEMLLAGRAAGDESRLKRYYELICRESYRLQQLVDNLLDLARIEEGRKQYRVERIETWEWLHGLADIVARRRRVDADLPRELPAIEGDTDALSSALLNLLDNAIKYSPEGAAVRLDARAEGGWVTIGVHDQGCGIAPEDQRRIFDRFYRGPKTTGGPAQGVGLGLALVKHIADAHGARIRVESTSGKGSTFYLALKATV